MAVIEQDSEPLTLGRLWSDKRYRAVITQILVVAGIFMLIAFLATNAVQNLEALGKTFGFAFLQAPAGYDINQTLIPYNSQDTHFRAGVVGLLNTGLIAITGCIFATILGFILGVLRLSSNWLINRIVYCYVEFTRNVPVLVQILLWHGVIVSTLPGVRQALSPTDGVFLTNRGFYVPKPIFEDGFMLVVVAFLAAIVGMVVFSRWAKKHQEATGQIYPVFSIGVAAIFGLPLIAFFIAGMPLSFDAPALQGFNFQGGIVVRPEYAALWFALSIYTAAFIAEIVRAGIQSVSHGQTEAAFALGVKPNWTMRLIIVPQALRVIVPPLTSQYLNLTKNSSLAIAIGYMDIVATFGGITLNQTGKEMEVMIIVLTIYLTISLLISAFMNWYNRRIALVER
ncbi:amino acid ABC transporter permease [Pelagibius litoralis]|uniref:Amino acid ABC transporter permease n=1 Tax=Pelagibius litoralis TaxID=374515 RepID=A0A967EUL6_9PROT|nr:amino acid ABC transporter permease [Pelagibius litoralis]NIA67187.1 amino acid ABC transporter permease [Pelagibius litoralis]